MTPFSLLDRPWIPVRRRSGARARIRPADLASDHDRDPIVALDWPRPDFDAACRELLIGLLALAAHDLAADEERWFAWWERPPDPDALGDRLAKFSHAFLLDGPGPRFLQDFEDLPGEPEEIGKILIEAPGEQTLKRNIDHFVKRGGVPVLGRAAAAMALFTLQDFAPAGGAGIRTSLRGGGPLVSFVLPPADGEEPSLWRQLWLDVVWKRDWPPPTEERLPKILPWLAPTRTSEHNEKTTPADVHPAQAYFGMPRRIRLVFEENREERPCALTGEIDPVIVTGFVQRPRGTNYLAWRHPLTPYYRQKPESSEWLPVHPQPYRLGYRDWLGLVVADRPGEDALRRPAEVVEIARTRLVDLDRRTAGWARLRVAGYDMDNMKARGFVEAEIPVPLLAADRRGTFEALVRELVGHAREVATALGIAVRDALWKGDAPDAAAGDRYLAQERFWDRSEPEFRGTLRKFVRELEAATGDDAVRTALESARNEFGGTIRKLALAIFDELVRFDEIDADHAMQRKIEARRILVSRLERDAQGSDAGPAARGGRRRRAA
jgi:CRISPR system Cascade subunit CasA